MNLANIGHDLNAYSKGRFTLGLGSQIKPHITKRFSMHWGAPAEQMRELVLAMRAIWANWYEGAPLEFVGKHYRHTLMTPAFTPEDKTYGAPRVMLAAVGPRMTEVAGEVADGMIIHPFSTLPYIEKVTLPAIDRGLAKAGRSRDDFELSYSCFVVTGRDEQDFAASRKAARDAGRLRRGDAGHRRPSFHRRRADGRGRGGPHRLEADRDLAGGRWPARPGRGPHRREL
jgi:probable F420-dependent oxidoreductase